MQMTVSFTRWEPKRDFYTDNLECWFAFSVVDSSLIGTPREIGSAHTVKVIVTDALMNQWNLVGAEGSWVSEEMTKIAFQSAEEYISEQLRKGLLLERELPPLSMSTKDSPSSCPYNIANIHYPAETTFEVTVNEPHKLDQERQQAALPQAQPSAKLSEPTALAQKAKQSASALQDEQEQHAPEFLQETTSHVDSVLLVTVNLIETRAVLSAVKQCEQKYAGNITYYDLGMEGGVHLFLIRSGMGAVGPSGSAAKISEAIPYLKPTAIIAVGIAFGVDPAKQEIGDILISERVCFYGPQRVGTTPDRGQERIPRGDRASIRPRLLDRFKDGEVHWSGPRLRFGLMLSGDWLVDNKEALNELVRQEHEAIGGEMEAVGIYSIAGRDDIDWIVVKAISDWADGSKANDKKANQELAAKNAAEFVFFVIRRGGLAQEKNSPSSPAALKDDLEDWIDISEEITNPGFEDGFLGWEEDSSVIDSEQADSRSVDDSSEAHTGSHSRKLFLRWGGSYIKQTIRLTNPLPAQCQIRLGVHAKMPFRGSSANKWFTLMLVAHGRGSDQVEYAQAKPPNALVEWTKIVTQTERLKYPIHELEIHALTTKGGGAHRGFDKPVWVDDFTIEYRSPYTEENPRYPAASDVGILATEVSLKAASNGMPKKPAFERVLVEEGKLNTVTSTTSHQLITELVSEFKLVRKTLEHNLQLPLDDTLQPALKIPVNEIKTTIASLDFEELTEAAQDYFVQAASINALVDRYNDAMSTGKGTNPLQMGVPGSSLGSWIIQQIATASEQTLRILVRLEVCLQEARRSS